MRTENSRLFHLSRRGLLVGGVTLAAHRLARAADPVCSLATEQEVGPYYVDDALLRREIREGRPGLPLDLRIAIVDARTCAPLPNAAVDIWHCDALGVYSGYTANSPDGGGPGGPGGPPPGGRPPGPPPGGGPGGGARRPSDATRFLRGVQLTGPDGLAIFSTLYPGWYSGRTLHIHLKVRLGGAAGDTRYQGGHTSHTGQLFFPEEITAAVAGLAPYATRRAIHRTLQTEDHIFLSQNGRGSLMALDRLSPRSNEGGFRAAVTLAVDPEATPAPVGGPGGPPRGR